MSLRIGDALQSGLSRTAERNGLLLVGLFVGFGLINTVVAQSLSAAVRRMADTPAGQPSVFQAPAALAIPIPLPVSFVLLLAFALVAETLRVVAVRVFATETRHDIPDSATDDLLGTVLNAFVAGLVASIGIGLASIALVVPGIFLAVALFFVRQEVAIDGKNAVDALSGSWRLTKGNRWSVLGLGLIIFVISLGISLPGLVIRLISPAVGAVVSVVLNGVITVFAIAATTRAYVQLREETDDTPEPGETGRV